MNRIIYILAFALSGYNSYAQSGSQAVSGIKYRVNDTTAYQSAVSTAHAQGYADIYYNNQATSKHWDIWNGSSYDHVFDFNAGGGGGGTWGSITGTLSAQTDLQSALDGKQSRVIALDTETSNYVLSASDLSTDKLYMNSASANTVTFPDDATYDYPDGFKIVVTQLGAGVTSALAGGSAVLENSGPTLAISDRYASLVGTKRTANTWTIENGTASGITAAPLTFVNGTNVTISASAGSPSAALLSPVELTVGFTGPLSATNGGTGVDNSTITYTPTLTNSANIAASTSNICQYYRVGNVVTVSGVVSIDPTTTATLTTLGISLPVPSNFATAVQAGGTAVAYAVAGSHGGIFSDATNDRVTLQFVPIDVTNQPFSFTFTYQVL